LAEIDGVVSAVEERGGVRMVSIRSNEKTKKPKEIEYLIPRVAEVYVKQGEEVTKGTRLSEGPLDLKELFELKGAREVERYIINEVQKIYLSEGAAINNKHIEVIIRQMFSRVKVKEEGDANFVVGDVLEKSVFLEANRALKKKGKTPAKGEILLMGITKVALSTQSFLSAASFIETAKVLINAAIEGKVDALRGLKENVIIGRLIPAGTGLKAFREENVEKAPKEVEA
jgi:DNA-directed RNA polymerase subunit beta'